MRITALMFVTMVAAALIVDGLFSALGLIPTGPAEPRGHLRLDRAGLQAGPERGRARRLRALFSLTMRRGVTDPVCG